MEKSLTCCLADCKRPAFDKQRRWCSMHYQRWRKHGDPLISKINREQTGKSCAIDGCDSPAKHKSYCALHGDRLRRTGNPLLASLGTRHLRHQRWMLENKSHNGAECLVWPFYRGSNGRAVTKLNGIAVTAPYAMCFLAHGTPPTEDHEAAHSCGNGHLGCVNPKHLRWATRKENEADKLIHGTLRCGSKINTAKLVAEQVLSIRQSDLSNKELAEKYGVEPSHIWGIKKGKSWAWLV